MQITEVTSQMRREATHAHIDLLRAQGGILPIAMHLFYQEHPIRRSNASTIVTPKKKAEKMLQLIESQTVKRSYYPALLRYLRTTQQSILLAEEKDEVETTLALLEKIGYTPPLYVVATQRNEPIPLIGYQAMMRYISDLMPSKLSLAGQQLSIGNSSETISKPLYPFNGKLLGAQHLQRCVGRFIQQCHRSLGYKDIAIELSKLTFPAQRD